MMVVYTNYVCNNGMHGTPALLLYFLDLLLLLPLSPDVTTDHLVRPSLS